MKIKYCMHLSHFDMLILQVLEHEKVYLEALPSAAMYERSYMHRDQITQVAVAPATDFIITGSNDGHLKFWKKRAEGIEFVKHFRAHLGAVDGENPKVHRAWPCMHCCFWLFCHV